MRPLSVGPTDRERFLAAVAEQVPVDRVVELYLFQPMRQGGVESGVAVIAAGRDVTGTDRSLVADAPAGLAADSGISADVEQGSEPQPPVEDGEPRYTVFTARYRHVLKGPDRGKWEVSVVAEADAPLAAVGAVVRGVQRRAGDVEPPEHMTGDALRDALAGGSAAQP